MRHLRPSSTFGRILCISLTIATLAPAGSAKIIAEAGGTPPKGKTEAKSAEAPKPSAGVFIVVRNEAGEKFKGREQAFEDMIASRITSEYGLSVISRAEAVQRLGATDSKPHSPSELEGAKVDAAFNDRTSALRLAQNLNAVGVLSVSILSLEKDTRTFSGNGINTVNDIYTLRASWKLLDASIGGSVRGDTIFVNRIERQTEGLSTNSDGTLMSLLDKAAQKVAQGINTTSESQRDTLTARASAKAKFSVSILAENIFFPDISVDKEGVVRLSQEKSPVTLQGVIVELDGAVVGTAPLGDLAVAPGLHKLRLSREGFKPWEGTVNISNGFHFKGALELTEVSLTRWREQAKFIEDIKSGTRLKEAEIYGLKAKADNLKNYGYKVEVKSDSKAEVKVEADSLPEDKSGAINVIR